MICQASPAHLFISSFEGIQKSLQRRLGIDNDMLPTRQLHNQIGPQPSALAENCLLLSEIAIWQHSRDLNHSPQLNFSPPTANVGCPQCAHQIPSYRLQLLW